MAYILNRIKQWKKVQKKTIRRELSYYTGKLLLSMLILVISGIGMYSLSVSTVTRENRSLFMVNNFYSSLQDVENRLYHSVIYGENTEYDLLLADCEGLLLQLEELSALGISTSYHRDIQDITVLMERYQSQIGTVQQCALRQDAVGGLLEAYYKAETAYILANNTFHTVYSKVMTSCEEYAEQAEKNRVFYMAVLFFTFLLLSCDTIIQIRAVAKNISLPVQRMVEELNTVELDSFHQLQKIRSSEVTNEDIRILVNVYNSMIGKIQGQLLERQEYTDTKLRLQEQRLENLEISNQLKKSQLLNLQTQINPHFLFNTLNMISQTAYLENDRKTITLLDKTADLLRYSLDYSEKAVTLAMEMEHLDDYVYLQEQRFGDRIQFLFELDEEFHDVKIPNLILQPLLENAIVHGVGIYTEGGRITIRSRYLSEEQMGCISIVDNGEGMDEETLEKVTRQMKSRKEKTGKIGLSNVYFRLSIFFDGKADIRLSSIPGEHTEVSILIPYKKAVRTEGGDDSCILSS